MKKIKILIAIALYGMVSSCSSDKHTILQEKKVLENQIEDIIVTTIVNEPVDGEYDMGDEEIRSVVRMNVLENDEIFICYDVASLVKIEIYGIINNATIEFVPVDSSKSIIILDKQDIEGEFSIVPLSSNDYLQHGRILIKSGDKKIKEIKMLYDGCL